MILDNNKKISGISYNLLNLPASIAMNGKGTISYIYNAAGNKMKKITVDSTVSPVKTTTTTYTGQYVYNNDTLQLISHEEGRIRPKLINPSNGYISSNIQYVYDFFIRDHLGNTRMVLTEETEQSTYAATMETATATVENALFDSVSSTQLGKPPGFDSDNSNQYVSRLNANSSINKIVGPAILLKVMAGDTLTASTYAWYNAAVAAPVSNNLLNSLLPTLTNGSIATSGGHYVTAQQSAISGLFASSLPSLLSVKDANYNSGLPKAFLNWGLFDERFNYVSGGVTQILSITGAEQKKAIAASLPSTIPQNGYLYIYVSNESPQDVFFDNITIQHKKGPLLEETHYYPFGLTMAGISSKALKTNYTENRYRFNFGTELQNKEFSDGSGLEMYDATFRMYDPQLGSFHSLDALSSNSSNESPFAFAMNNPIKYVDPLGLDTTTTKMNNGKIQIKTNPEQGDVLKIVDGKGNISYYTYDPDNPDANKQGYVGSGTESKPEPNVTVTAKKKDSGVPPWLLIAQGELGTRRNGDGTNNPRVLDYLHSVQPRGVNENTAWCAGFVNWTLQQSGIQGDNSLYAMNFAYTRWGLELNNPALGAIVVFNHHVGFVAGINADGRLVVLGGNQGPAPNGVNYGTRSASTVLPNGYRFPNGYTPNYNLPKYNIHGHVITFQNTR